MYYNPDQSYEQHKRQLQELQAEIRKQQMADLLPQHPSYLQYVTDRIGRVLIQLGTRMAQPGRQAKQVGG